MPPWVARNIIYALHEQVVGRPTYRVLREMEASQWWPAEALERLQVRKLRSLLLHAWDRCPGHRRRIAGAGLDRADLGRIRLEDLPALPLLDKATIRESLDGLVDRGVPGGARRYTTGGSTGEPLTFYFDRRRQAHDQAARMLTHAWFDFRFGEREVYLWGAPAELSKQDLLRALRDRLTNQLLLNAFAMSASSMAVYLDRIRRYRPACLFGYPSSLALLAEFALRRDGPVRLPGLKAVFVTGEKLYPHQREILREAFLVPVADCLGARDAGFLSHECPAGSMHLVPESVIVEAIDAAGRAVPPGESGELVVTHLENYAQPFIRYRTGDLGRLSAGTCPCGRGSPLMRVAEGRATDFLVRPDGAAVHALAVIYTLRELPGVRSFKVHQRSVDEVDVRLVRSPGYDPGNDDRIVREIRGRLGGSVRVKVVAVDSLPPERSGKFRYVTSDVAWVVPALGGGTPAAASRTGGQGG
jgi:phenylacetate-CoA ligase